LRRHGILAGYRIGGHELDFVDTDGGILVVAESFLELLGEVLCFGAAQGKSPDQPGEVLERDLVRKQDAGKSRGGQQLCETALRLAGFERDPVEKKFVVGDAEQKTSVTAFGQRLLEFAPGGLELAFGAFMGHSVEPGVFDQNIKAVEERPSGRTATGIGLGGINDNSLLRVLESSQPRLSGNVT